jgi:hypothetical protein
MGNNKIAITARIKSNSLFIYVASAIFFNCSSMVIPGFQPNKSHALELSTCNELNNLFAMSSLPISLAAKELLSNVVYDLLKRQPVFDRQFV